MNPVRTLVPDLGVQTLPFFFKKWGQQKEPWKSSFSCPVFFLKKGTILKKKVLKAIVLKKKVAFDTY